MSSVLLQGLMDFVLTHASQLLASGSPDAVVCLSAAQTISQMCEVAEGHDMAMQDTILNGLLQLIQQATFAEVGLSCWSCLTCFLAWLLCKRKRVLLGPPLLSGSAAEAALRCVDFALHSVDAHASVGNGPAKLSTTKTMFAHWDLV